MLYTLNILPIITYEDGECKNLNYLLTLLADTNELEIFKTKCIRDFLSFQWNSYAKFIQLIGGCIHLLYLILFIVYTNQVYLNRNFDNRIGLIWVMVICLIYPLVYDGMALYKQGLAEYSSDVWNFLDQGHIWIGLSNLLCQRYEPDILSHHSQVLMLIVTTLMLIKTFFYLRIFKELSFLVSMIMQVFFDLRVFFLFYFVLIFLFSLMFSIIDFGNYQFSEDPIIRNTVHLAYFSMSEY